MTKFICDICQEPFDEADAAFNHLVEVHGDVLEREYIIEDVE